jgi:hypothetical protein
MADTRNRVETSTDFTLLCCLLNHRTIRHAVQIFLHNRYPIRRSQDMRWKLMSVSCSPSYIRQISPVMNFLVNLPHTRSLNRSLSYRESTLTNKAPMRLSHARKNLKSYCRRHFPDCSWQSEMKCRASSVVGCGPQTATMRFHD